jgi:putative hydrolase of the HAD superfamily
LVLLFDLDDTLLDDLAARTHYLPILYQRFKRYIVRDFDSFALVWRNAVVKYHQRYAEGKISFDDQRVLRVKDSFNVWDLDEQVVREVVGSFDDLFEESWKPMSDTSSILENLHTYKKGIITNGSIRHQNAKIDKIGIRHYFDCVVISEEVGAAKPAKAIFDFACLQLGCSAEDCLFIGDSWENDVVGSSHAGMQPVWFNRYQQPIPRPLKNLSVISSLKELLKLVDHRSRL